MYVCMYGCMHVNALAQTSCRLGVDINRAREASRDPELLCMILMGTPKKDP